MQAAFKSVFGGKDTPADKKGYIKQEDTQPQEEFFPPEDLPLYKGLGNTFTHVPKKIACGLNHTAAITNVNQDREIFLSSMETTTKQKAKNELYMWGRNMPNNLTGMGTDINDCPAPQRAQFPSTLSSDAMDFNDPGVYEVSLGTNHTMVLMAGKETDHEIGQVYGIGLGSAGRLGVERPSYAKDDSWFTENHGTTGIAAIQVKFEGAYRVVDKPKDGPKTDGINFHSQPDREAKDRKAVLVWGSNIHGKKTEDGLWLKVEDSTGPPKYLPMISDNGTKLVLQVKIQILRIACGGDHTMALATNGVLYSWGLNNDGQCGVDSSGVDHSGNVLRPQPVVLPVTDYVQHFACGSRHSLAVNHCGALYSWGCNQQGRLGIGKEPNQFLPVRNTFCGDASFTFVACGEAHSGAIDEAKRVWTWGAGAHGRLGHGETVDTPTPQTIEVLEEVKVAQLALGGFHSVCFANAPKPQKVYTWGMGHASGQSPDGKSQTFSLPQAINLNNADDADGLRDVTQIACGAYHTMFLLRNGTILMCGLGSGGRLGLANGKEKSTKDAGIPQAHARFKGYALRMKSDPTVMNFRRDSEKYVEPKEIVGKRADGMVKVAWDVEQIGCGQMHSAIRTVGGDVFIWGDNDRCQLGRELDEGKGKTIWTPTRLSFGNKITYLAIGEYHNLAVTDMGVVYAWGRGDEGQLGTGRQHDTPIPARIDQKHFSDGIVIKIAASADHSAAIVQGHEGNSLFMWGNSENGKLGLGASVRKFVPQPKEVDCDWGQKKQEVGQAKAPVFVACAPSHTAVIVAIPGDAETSDKNGELWTFGGGMYGKLGVKETQENLFDPFEVKELEGGDPLRIALGAYHSTAIMGQPGKYPDQVVPGDLWAWGRNKMVCEPEHLYLPKKFNFIEESTKFLHVSCSSSHTLAVMESGVVYAWGDNTHGQLGLGPGSGKEESRPQQVKKLPGVAMQIVAAPMHSIVLLNNGELHAWGNQSCGRLGLEAKVKEKDIKLPHKVKAEWASIEEITVSAKSMKKHAADEEEVAPTAAKDGDAKDDEAARMLESLQSGQKVQQFKTMQSLLKSEKPQNKERELKRLEAELIQEIEGYLKDIKTISVKEGKLVQLEADINQGVGSVVRCIKQVKAPDIACKVDPKVMEKISYYEELMWVLQQQPCYLASLSTTISGGEDAVTFNNIVKSVFHELEDPRTLHLYMTLLKLLIDKEVDRANNMEALFNSDSIVFHTFSWFAKRPQFYKEVVWMFMKTDDVVKEKDKLANEEKKKKKQDDDKAQDKETLLTEIFKKKETLFALDRKEFKDARPGEEKDAADEMADFMDSIKELKEFMNNGPFEKAIMGAMLHENVRKMLYHCIQKIQSRTFSQSEKERDLSVPKEFMICEPILKLVMNGIVIPLLENPQKYSGVEVLLSKSRHKEIEDGYTQTNISVICRFLKDIVMAGKYDGDKASADMAGKEAEVRQLASISRQTKLFLLRYMKELSNFIDDTETHTTVDVYMSHYDRHAHSVAVQTADLLKISNMLRTNDSKVRQTDDDPCVTTCQLIGEWSQDIVKETSEADSEKNVVHNFTMNNRFLLDKKYANLQPPLTVCRTSSVPMPSRFCVGSDSLLKAYQIESADSMSKTMEDLFREIEDVDCNTWTELKNSLEEQLKHATNKNPPNFVLAHKLKQGISKVDELRAVDYQTADLMNDMSEKLMARNRHRIYLEQVQKGLHLIKKAQLEHSMQVKNAENTVRQMAEFTSSLKLPDVLREEANKAGVGKLTLEQVKAKMVGQKLDRREKLTNCTFVPTTTVDLSKLKRDQIVLDVHESVAAPQTQNKISVTMALAMDGGLEVDLNMKKHKATFLLRQFTISSDQLQQFKKVQEGTKKIIPSDTDNVMTVDPAKLAAFIMQVTSGA